MTAAVALWALGMPYSYTLFIMWARDEGHPQNAAVWIIAALFWPVISAVMLVGWLFGIARGERDNDSC